MWLVILSTLLGPAETCNSTRFGDPGDKQAGKTARYLGRPVDPAHDLGVAHRSLELGTLVYVTIPESGKSALLIVIDRGPYGRRTATGEWYNGATEYRKCRKAGVYPLRPECYPPGSKWNGCLDITPAATRLLGHDGWARAIVRPIRGFIVPRSVLLAAWGGNV